MPTRRALRHATKLSPADRYEAAAVKELKLRLELRSLRANLFLEATSMPKGTEKKAYAFVNSNARVKKMTLDHGLARIALERVKIEIGWRVLGPEEPSDD